MDDLRYKITSAHDPKGVADATAHVGKFHGILQKAAGGILGPLAAGISVIAAVRAAWQGAVSAIRNYAAFQEKILALDQALANSAQLTKQNHDALQQLASQLQETTAIADDDWLDVLLTLINTHQVSVDTITKHIDVVKNLAGLMGGNLQAAAQLYSRALLGQTEMLSRYGIVVDKDASLLQQLDQIQEQAARGSGILEARAASLNGQWSRYKNNVSDVVGGLGRLVGNSRLVSGALESFNFVLEKEAQLLPKTVTEMAALGNVSDDNAKKLRQQSEEAAKFATQIVATGKAAAGSMKLYSDTLRTIVDNETALREAQGKRAKAQIDLALATGQIGKDEADRQKSLIDASNESNAALAEQAAIEAEIHRNRQELIDATNAESDARINGTADQELRAAGRTIAAQLRETQLLKQFEVARANSQAAATSEITTSFNTAPAVPFPGAPPAFQRNKPEYNVYSNLPSNIRAASDQLSAVTVSTGNATLELIDLLISKNQTLQDKIANLRDQLKLQRTP